MATKKSTTSSKTKTVKKTPTNRTQSARSSKVSTNITAVKAVSRRAKVVQKLRSEVFSVGRLLAAGALVYLALALLAGLLMDSTTYSLTLTHLTTDPLLSNSGTTFVSAVRPVFDLELRWVVVGLLLFSTILPVLYLTKLKEFYANRLANRRVIGLRWVDLAVSSMLMVQVISILCGISDLMTLKLLGAMMITTCALGWLAETQNENANRPLWGAFGISLFTGLMPWIAIGTTKTATLLFGEVRSPWYVYALCASTLIGFILLGLNQWNQHRRFRNWADYVIVERNYLLINMATKVAFAVILIVGLSK